MMNCQMRSGMTEILIVYLTTFRRETSAVLENKDPGEKWGNTANGHCEGRRRHKQDVPWVPAKKGNDGLQTAPSVNVYRSPESLQSQNQPT